MTDANADPGAANNSVAKKSGKMPLIIGLVLAILGGAGGFYAVSSGLLLGKNAAEVAAADSEASDDEIQFDPMYSRESVKDFGFVELSPLVVSLGPDSNAQFLRFKAAIETVAGAEDEVARLEPRILDVMNDYLRALGPADIEAPDGLFVVRAQLTRRLELVLGKDLMIDLLVMEFLLN